MPDTAEIENDQGRKRGGQPGNSNAVRVEVFRDFTKLDERTAEGRMIRHAEMILAGALGETSPQQAAICRTIAVAMWRLSIIEALLVDEQRRDQPNYQQIDRFDIYYLRWSNHVRDGLRMIGLQRVPAPIRDICHTCSAEAIDYRCVACQKHVLHCTCEPVAEAKTEATEETAA